MDCTVITNIYICHHSHSCSALLPRLLRGSTCSLIHFMFLIVTILTESIVITRVAVIKKILFPIDYVYLWWNSGFTVVNGRHCGWLITPNTYAFVACWNSRVRRLSFCFNHVLSWFFLTYQCLLLQVFRQLCSRSSPAMCSLWMQSFLFFLHLFVYIEQFPDLAVLE